VQEKNIFLPPRFCPSGQFGKPNAHCTHLQIAQADTQTEICKRVQLPNTVDNTIKLTLCI